MPRSWPAAALAALALTVASGDNQIGFSNVTSIMNGKAAAGVSGASSEDGVRNSLEKAGVDPSKVEFVEIPFPDVPAALARSYAARSANAISSSVLATWDR
jgi:hypothetical protein